MQNTEAVVGTRGCKRIMTVEPETIALLRRALVERRESDWERAYALLYPRVRAWVQGHPSFPLSGEDAAYFINRALERLWRAVDGERVRAFEGAALLQYLKLCVHSVILDELRGTDRNASASLEAAAPTLPDPAPGPEEQALAAEERRTLWTLLQRLVQDPRELLLLEAAFVRALPPREIAARHPTCFTSAREVYAVKRRLLARLARNPELRALVGRLDRNAPRHRPAAEKQGRESPAFGRFPRREVRG